MGISFTYVMSRWVSPPAHMLGHCCSVATDFGCLRVEKPTELGHRRRRVDRWPAFGVNDCTVASVGTGTGDLAPANKGTTAVGSGKRSEEHTSELQSLMRISYAVFCLKKKNK